MCGIVKLHPARGRKLCCPAGEQCLPKLQFIPARGRKLLDGRALDVAFDCNLSPRGDGNSRAAATGSTEPNCNLPPQGDGNSFRILFVFGVTNCNLSPQGDGNGSNSSFPQNHSHCNLSPQGDKKAPPPLAFASSGGALLFLIFYFTGWELHLPGSSL